jgi:hypothetical protein
MLGEGEGDASAGCARAAVDELIGALGVDAGELIEVSYFELMTQR